MRMTEKWYCVKKISGALTKELYLLVLRIAGLVADTLGILLLAWPEIDLVLKEACFVINVSVEKCLDACEECFTFFSFCTVVEWGVGDTCGEMEGEETCGSCFLLKDTFFFLGN